MESADYWPIVNINPKTLGDKPELVAVFGCDRWMVDSSRGSHLTSSDNESIPEGLCCGEYSGGNWMEP